MSNSQTVPWEVQRVSGPYNAINKRAWVLDSGVENHPDLNLDESLSTSFISGETHDDDNGHGTSVAGIIAAIDNNRDVAGVAAGATIIAVRVCFDSFQEGGCPNNKLIAGIDYAVSNGTQ